MKHLDLWLGLGAILFAVAIIVGGVIGELAAFDGDWRCVFVKCVLVK